MKNYNRLLGVVVIGLIAIVGAAAQTSVRRTSVADRYVISANAGGVNLVTGSVTVTRADGTSGILIKGDQVEIGDKISTGDNGRIELLLNPGSYLRIGSNTDFAFKTTSLDDLQVRVDKGHALFEVLATDDFRVTVITPQDNVALVESGIYRVDVGADGTGTIAVSKGKALVGGADTATKIKKGRTGTLDTVSGVTVAKFDRDELDSLGEWSKSRSKELAKMASSLQNDNVRDSLISSFNFGRWNIMDSFGVWVFNPFTQFYCFLPFGYGWSSPYGYGFGQGIGWYRLPRRIIDPVVRDSGRRNPPSTSGEGRRKPIDGDDPAFKSIDRRNSPAGQMNDPVFSPRRSPAIMPPMREPMGQPSAPRVKGKVAPID